ncbi:MAG: tyrosine-type recombinase/integrase, partial [Novipirellula sp. JB048]
AGLLRILNRDLEAAGIDKIDAQGRRIHLHAMRHSTGTHLSAAGVSPRTAQAVMRHSDITLTMNTYTDERLLETSVAVELLPSLPIMADTEAKSSVAPTVAPATYKTCQSEPKAGKIGKVFGSPRKQENPAKRRVLRGFSESGRLDLNQRPLRPERSEIFR